MERTGKYYNLIIITLHVHDYYTHVCVYTCVCVSVCVCVVINLYVIH